MLSSSLTLSLDSQCVAQGFGGYFQSEFVLEPMEKLFGVGGERCSCSQSRVLGQDMAQHMHGMTLPGLTRIFECLSLHPARHTDSCTC